MLVSPDTGRTRRRLRLITSLLSSVALLAGCASLEGSVGSANPDLDAAREDTQAPTRSASRLPALNYDENKSWTQLLEVGDATAQDGELGTAAMLYKEAHFKQPNAPEPLRRLGAVLLRMGHPMEASEAYKSLLALNQEDADARLGLARSLIGMNRPYAASLQFKRLVEGRPDDVEAMLGLGVSYDLMGDHERAQETFRNGLAFDPRNSSLLNNLGHSLTRAGRYDDAIEVLQVVVDLPGTTARHRHNLALAYGLSGKLREAAELMAYDLDNSSLKQNLAYFRSQSASQTGLAQLSLARPLPPVEPVTPPPPAAASQPAPAPSATAQAPRAPANVPAQPSTAQTAINPPLQLSGTAAPAGNEAPTDKPTLGSTPHATAAALAGRGKSETAGSKAANGNTTTAAIAPPLPEGEESIKSETAPPNGGKEGVVKESQSTQPSQRPAPQPAKVPAQVPAQQPTERSSVPHPAVPAKASQPAQAKKPDEDAALDRSSNEAQELTLLAELTYHASPLPSLPQQEDAALPAENTPVSLFTTSAR